MEYLTEMERRYIPSLDLRTTTAAELRHAEEIGHDVAALRARFDALPPSDPDGPDLAEIHREVPREPPASWPHFEGSDLAAVVAELPADPDPRDAPHVDDLAGRLRGTWYGRVAGNMLGKPVEFPWPRADLRRYLERLGEYPLRDYVPIRESDLGDLLAAGFVGNEMMPYAPLSRGRIDGGVRDDDVDWTILNLALLEDFGIGFTRYDVGRAWTERLPIYQTYTAERVAYHNLVREVPLEEVGAFRNPYRELIGALIRADVFGYVSPGRPRRAALLAHRDAYLSHRANGVYGEMWAAALIAAAFTAPSAAAAVRESLRHVPPSSRLAVEIGTVVADHGDGLSWDACLDRLDARWPVMDGGHTINNAGALTAAILYADGDFTGTVAGAVQAGLDSDSIGATAGSFAGALVGYDAIPEHWVTPLRGHTRSAVFGHARADLDDLAARTGRLELAFRTAAVPADDRTAA